jgi:hypothetical protein
VLRRFDSARRVQKFAHFRAIRLVQHKKLTARRDAESDAFTCPNVFRSRAAVIVRNRQWRTVRNVCRKKNRWKKDVLFLARQLAGVIVAIGRPIDVRPSAVRSVRRGAALRNFFLRGVLTVEKSVIRFRPKYRHSRSE